MPHTLTETIALAIRLCERLAHEHAHGRVVGNLCPDALEWDESTQTLELVELSLDVSTRIARYRAPEQRSSQVSEDPRADLYSLGAILYEALSGPSTAWGEQADARATAIPLHEQRGDIPRVISRIVARLLAEAPAERYQSALGLLEDLRECRDRLTYYGTIPDFRIGSKDHRGPGELSQRMYERTPQMRELERELDAACSGPPRLVLLSGFSGTGKTLLARTLVPPTRAKKGFFLEGKFQQIGGEAPYSALATALEALVLELLRKQSEELEEWRAIIERALGINARVLVDLSPALNSIIRKAPAVTSLAPTEAHNRLHRVFLDLIRAIASPEHPVVLFLDDLQWADDSTLALVETALDDKSLRGFLLVGAARTEEDQQSARSLPRWQEALRARQVPMHVVALRSLSVRAVTQLLHDAMHMPFPTLAPLAEVAVTKTSGIPLALKQFFASIEQAGLLTRAPDAKSWIWDVEKIRQSGEAIDLSGAGQMWERKLEALEPKDREIIEVASCLGMRFGLADISAVIGGPEVDTRLVRAAMARAEERGLVSELTDNHDATAEQPHSKQVWMFVHDSVQLGVYASMSTEKRTQLHLSIGNRLLAYLDSGTPDEQIYAIVTHLNRARAEVAARGEREELARLNHVAGKHAKAAVAFQLYAELMERAREILPDDIAPDVRDEIDLDLAEARFLTRRYDAVFPALGAVLESTRPNHIAKIRSYSIIATMELARGKPGEGLRLALIFLARYDRRIRLRESPRSVVIDLVFIAVRLMFSTLKKIESLPSATDAKYIAMRALYFQLVVNSFHASPYTMVPLFRRLLSLTLKYGHSWDSPLVFVGLALSFATLNRNKWARLLAELAERLAVRYPESPALELMHVILGNILGWRWSSSAALSKGQINLGLQALRSGRVDMAGNFLANAASLAFASPGKLADLVELGERARDTLGGAEHYLARSCILPIARLAETLRGGDAKHDFDFHWNTENRSDRQIEMIYESLSDGYLRLVLHRGPTTREVVNALMVRWYGRAFSVSSLTLALLLPLLIIRLCREENRRPSWGERRVIHRLKRLLKSWAKSGPQNFLHRHALLEAEYLDLRGKHQRARKAYSYAISAALESGVLQNAGLALELSAESRIRSPRASDTRSGTRHLLLEARRCYEQWGAIVKVREMNQRYQAYLEDEPSALTSADQIL